MNGTLDDARDSLRMLTHPAIQPVVAAISQAVRTLHPDDPWWVVVLARLAPFPDLQAVLTVV